MKKTLLFFTLLTFSLLNAQIVTIPDANFKAYLLNNSSINTNGDTEIQVSEAENTTVIDCSNKFIYDLTGIEAFVNLLSLNCSNNSLYTLDITQNTSLTKLNCSNDQLSTLDVTQNLSLIELDCSSNPLNTIEISQNTNLEKLYCSYNQLNILDITQNTSLTELDCSFNQLNNLDVTQNMSLTELDCSSNQLNTLNITQNMGLIELDCSSNPLNAFDITQNTSLTKLNCSNDQLSTLDVSQHTSLRVLNCSSNPLNTLDVTQNMSLTRLNCNNDQLSTLDVTHNTNLYELECSYNQLNTLDLTQNINLEDLWCSYNQLSTLNLTQNTSLFDLDCSYNQLSTLDVTQNIDLGQLYCNNNQLSYLNVGTELVFLDGENNNLTSLELSGFYFEEVNFKNNQLETVVLDNFEVDALNLKNNNLSSIDLSNTNIGSLNISNNTNLEYINFKNGNNSSFTTVHGNDAHDSNFTNLPNLQTVCVDELNTDLTNFISTETGHPITYTTYCSFEPAKSNTITGTSFLDLDDNGCDNTDIVFDNFLITANNGTESFSTYAQADGSYSLSTNEGDFTTNVTPNLPSYFSANPINYTNNFTGFNNTFNADFCITTNQTVNDVNITIVPISQTRPGFNVSYKIIYKNVGTTQLSGNIYFTFDETKLDFLSATETVNNQTANSLTFNYTNLNSLETRSIKVDFNVHTPTASQPTNNGDVLDFTAVINPITGDYTVDDNTFTLHQTVIGSYDPNDMTCTEGNEILIADASKYLHYVIRFQNTGTADAINVVVKNILDDKLDWNTLQLETTSHANRVAIKNGNEVEFIFEDIHLPDSTTDEAGSHGYIAYKIKPKDNVVLGDTFNNKADIFFDYNAAIETNIASTTIVNTLAVNNAQLLQFSVYPTPTKDILYIQSKTALKSVAIYSKLGQLVLKNTNTQQINISKLASGIYFVKVQDVYGDFGVRKIVKE